MEPRSITICGFIPFCWHFHFPDGVWCWRFLHFCWYLNLFDCLLACVIALCMDWYTFEDSFTFVDISTLLTVFWPLHGFKHWLTHSFSWHALYVENFCWMIFLDKASNCLVLLSHFFQELTVFALLLCLCRLLIMS